MSRFKIRSLTIFMALCMLAVSVPQSVFATDYENHWAENAISKWSDNGLVVGYEDGTFRPSKAITRGELAAILVRVFDYSKMENTKEYTDVEKGKWYTESIAIISSAGLMNSGEDTFRPDEPATREEAAYAIANAYKVTGTTDEEFTDQVNISDWASASVEALHSNGYVSGNPDGTFAPQRTLTRADTVSMLDKITSGLINAEGTYTDDVHGNLVISTRDVVLKDMTIKGNLYLTEGIGDGDVTLDNITVEGETFVNGGGLNSIIATNSKFLKSMKVSAKNPVRIVVKGDAVEIEAFPGTTVTLTGNFSEVILPPGVNVIIKDATVEKIFVKPGFAEDKDEGEAVITIEEGSTVNNIQADAPVQTKGKGKIDNLTVNSAGVKTEQKPGSTTVKDNVEYDKPAPSGGGGGGSSGEPSKPSKPSKAEYLLSGKVTYEGKPVAYVETEVYGDGINKRGQTDENGNYSFYVPANKPYGVNAWLVDDEGFGYFTSIDNKTSNANQTLNIELEKKYVANIKVTDKNNNLISGYINVREVYEDGSKGGGWHVDSNGYAIIFLWNENDPARNFNIYSGDILIGEVKDVKRGNDFRTLYQVKLDYEMKDTITGKVQDEDGNLVKGKTVHLRKLSEDGQGSRGVDDTITNDKGEYTFKGLDKNASYSVNAKYEDNGDAFGSNSLNILFAEKHPLIVRQHYSIEIKSTDKSGAGIDAEVEVRDANNNSYRTHTGDDGRCLVYANYLLPGKQIVTVTIGDKVIVQELVIKKGTYNYNLNFKFDDIVRNLLNVEFDNIYATVGDENIKANHVVLAVVDGEVGRYKVLSRSTIDSEGKSTLYIPGDFKGDEVVLRVYYGDDIMNVKEDISLENLDGTLKMDLNDKIRKRKLKGEMSITTGSAIRFTTATSIDFDLKLGHSENNISVVKGDVAGEIAKFEIDALVNAPYIITANYIVDGREYKFEEEIYVGGGFVEIPNGGFVIEHKDHTLTVKLGIPDIN